jgi:hypothetical protein
MHLVLDKGLGFFVSYNSAGKGELDVRSALWNKFLDRYFPPAGDKAETGASNRVEGVSGKYLSSRRAQTTIMRSLWWVLAESSVSQLPDGTIEVDNMKDFAGQPKQWRRIGNMQFRESGGPQLLVFKRDAKGNMEMITEDPIEIQQRVGWSENKTVVLVALGFAALVFALTIVLWPVGALLRRHYEHPLSLSARERKLRMLVKLGCIIDLVALLAFAGTVVYGFSNLALFSERLDPWLRVVQLLFILAIVGTLAMIYSSYRLWKNTAKGAWHSAYTAGLIVASVIFIWFAAISRVLQTSLKY